MTSRSIRFISAALAVATLAAAGRYERTEADYKAPAVTLVDSTGEAVRLDRLLATDQPVALQFIFTTCPGVCPTLTATLAELGRRAPEAKLISISIDPEVDTPARLAEYKERFGGAEGWRFLTGRSEDVIAAQQAFESYRGEKMRHQPLTFVRPGGRKSWVRFEGYPTAEELALELAPAADPTLGGRLYQDGVLASGAALEVRLATGGVLRGKAAACATCHRPSGFGGVEAGLFLPPITGPYLFGGRENRRIDLFHELFQEELASEVWARLRQRPARPPYSAATFRSALETGHDPTGRAFDPVMPRYSLNEEDLANLSAYLGRLGSAWDPGVDAEAIRFATVVAGSGDSGPDRARLGVLEAFFRLKNADTARLRLLSPDPLGHEEHFAPAYRDGQRAVWRLGSAPAEWPRELEARLRERPVFALVALPGSAAGPALSSFCDAESLPCLVLEDLAGSKEAGAFTRRLPAGGCSAGEPPEAFRSRQWLRARGIPAGAEDGLELATYHLLTVTEAALMHLLDDFSRAYFLESLDREAGRMPSPVGCRFGKVAAMDSNELKKKLGIKDADTYRIDPDTGVVQREGLLGWKDTETRVDPESGDVQEKGFFGWRDTEIRIDPKSGVVQEEGFFGHRDTDTRIDPESGVIQEKGFFGWKAGDERIEPGSGKRQVRRFFGWKDK